MKRISTIVLALALSTAALKAQWTQTNGPEGGNIRALATVGQTVLATTWPDALYRFDPACNCWSRIGRLVADRFDVVGTTIIASTDMGLQSSTNGGADWRLMGPPGETAIEAADGGVLYAADSNRLYRSTDAGATWKRFGKNWATTGTTQADLCSLTVRGQVLVAVGDSLQYGVVRSTDGGENWEMSAAGFPEGTVVSKVHFFGDTLLAQLHPADLSGSLGFYASTDSGTTWTPLNDGLPEEVYGLPLAFFFYRDGSAIAISTYSGAFRLENGRWVGTAPSIVSAVAVDSAGKIYRGDLTGISRSDDDGTTWERIDRGLLSQHISAVGGRGTTVIASGGNGLYRSIDRGLNWTRTRTIRAEQFAYDRLTILARGTRSTEQGIVRSTDDGATWEDANLGITHPLPWVSALAATDDLAFLAMQSPRALDSNDTIFEGGLYRSTDAGASWTLMTEGLPHIGDTTIGFDRVAVNGRNAVATAGGTFYHTTDGGESWAPTGYTIPPHRRIEDLIAIGSRFYMATSNTVWRSDDFGETWIMTGGVPLQEMVQSITSLNGNPLVLTGSAFGSQGTRQKIYRLFRNQWVALGDDLIPEGTLGGMIAVVNRSVYFATESSSVLRLDLETASVESEQSPRMAASWTPLPVRDDATLRFTLARAGEVTVELYDPTCSRALSMRRESLPAGENALQVPLGSLESGVYAYRIIASGVIVSGSVAVVRE